MKLIDVNLLIYAANRESPQHSRARAWVEGAMSGDETVGLPWVVVLGFLRVATSPRIFTKPLSSDAAIAIVDSWFARPNVVALNPGADHWRGLRERILITGTAGNLTTDTHLASLAIEHGAELCSADADFARFAGLHWVNPLAN